LEYTHQIDEIVLVGAAERAREEGINAEHVGKLAQSTYHISFPRHTAMATECYTKAILEKILRNQIFEYSPDEGTSVLKACAIKL
jgi:hypothetical protein